MLDLLRHVSPFDFWVSVVIVAILVNAITPILSWLIARYITRLADRYIEKRVDNQDRRFEEQRSIRESFRYQSYYQSKINSTQLEAILFLVLSAALLVIAHIFPPLARLDPNIFHFYLSVIFGSVCLAVMGARIYFRSFRMAKTLRAAMVEVREGEANSDEMV